MGAIWSGIDKGPTCFRCAHRGVSDIDGYIYRIHGRGKRDGQWICTACLIRYAQGE